MLEKDGLIVSTPAGRSVAPLGREITDPLIALIASHAEVVDDYLEFRATTERMAARLAAARASAVDRDRLATCMERIDRAHEQGNDREEAEADVALHIAVYEASHNLVVLHTMRALSGMLRQGVIENRETLFAPARDARPALCPAQGDHRLRAGRRCREGGRGRRGAYPLHAQRAQRDQGGGSTTSGFPASSEPRRTHRKAQKRQITFAALHSVTERMQLRE